MRNIEAIAGPVIGAAALHVVLLAAYVAAFGGDLSALACVSKDRLGQPPYEHVCTGFDRNGYDGQFYYAIARAPWRRHDLGVDAPAVRQARILYPALSWLLSGGDALRLFWVMPLVNVLAIAALAGLGAAVARRYGLSVWWGVLLPLAVNAGMPALRNLTDVLSTLTVGMLLAAWLLRWPWGTLALAAAAALFSREQNVVVVLLVLVFVAGSGPRRATVGLLAALLLWSAWLCVLRGFYGEWPMLPAGGNLGLPFAGMLHRWSHLAVGSRSLTLMHLLCLLMLTVQIGLAVCLVWTRADRLVALVALAGVALAVMGGVSLYGDSWSYPRVFAWLPLGAWLACAQVRWRWALAALSGPAVLPLAAVFRVWFTGV